MSWGGGRVIIPTAATHKTAPTSSLHNIVLHFVRYIIIIRRKQQLLNNKIVVRRREASRARNSDRCGRRMRENGRSNRSTLQQSCRWRARSPSCARNPSVPQRHGSAADRSVQGTFRRVEKQKIDGQRTSSKTARALVQ